MRFFQIFHLLVLAMIFSACSSVLSQLNGINNNIPKIKNIKTIIDVDSVAFEWDIIKDPNVRGYLVYRDSGEGYKEIAHIENPLVSHYVDTYLKPEKQYSYYFYVLYRDSYSDKSDTIKIKTSYIAPVTNLYASNDYPRKVKLLWNPHQNPSISHYIIQRGDSNNHFKTIASIDNRLSVEYFDENLNDASVYKYRIIAVDFLGTRSRPSKIVFARTKDRPSININLYASNEYIDRIELKWDKQENIQNYNIYRANKSNVKYTQIASTKNTRFVDAHKSPNSKYFYKVSGIDISNIESLPSNEVVGSTKAILNAPNIKGYIDNNKAKIEWNANPNAKYYIVYRSSGFFSNDSTFKINETYFVDNDMVSNTKYSYYVVAVDEFGVESQKSQEITLQIK